MMIHPMQYFFDALTEAFMPNMNARGEPAVRREKHAEEEGAATPPRREGGSQDPETDL